MDKVQSPEFEAFRSLLDLLDYPIGLKNSFLQNFSVLENQVKSFDSLLPFRVYLKVTE